MHSICLKTCYLFRSLFFFGGGVSDGRVCYCPVHTRNTTYWTAFGNNKTGAVLIRCYRRDATTHCPLHGILPPCRRPPPMRRVTDSSSFTNTIVYYPCVQFLIKSLALIKGGGVVIVRRHICKHGGAWSFVVSYKTWFKLDNTSTVSLSAEHSTKMNLWKGIYLSSRK